MAELLKNRYELLEPLGAGGEARVVKALDRQHDRLVALKIRQVRNGHARAELLGEARILLAIAPHPALPLVREDFFEADAYVVAMDWVDGVDLATLLADRGRPGLAPSSVLAYLAQAAEALTHLHAQDPPVLHGDVKPANLILTKGGRIKLVDFGLSSAPDVPRRRTGTPGFRAPELAAVGLPSRASDIYGLAATAFALLTGAPPSGRLPSWDGVDPAQAEQLEGAIRLGLATDPARRPETPGELVERLRAGWGETLPSGVMTFCMSDIEGSAALWEADPGAMAEAVVRHDEIVADAVESRGGRLIESMGEGDSTVSVFDSAPEALEAALAATRALAELPFTVRFGLHAGEAERRGAHYFGPTLNLAARLRDQADGGQIFLSSVTADLVQTHLPEGCELVDLGPHRLKGLGAPERIRALSGPGLDAPLPATECPYRGLLAFEAEDRAFFFGREEVVRDLIARQSPGRLVAVVGASGSGKSSVLRAGLVAAVEAGEVPGVDRARLVTPGASLDDGDPAELLVLDQFEELFALTGREAFIDALLALSGPVVIALRADFYGRLGTHAGLARAVAGNQILLGVMTDDELRRAVTEPARLAGLRLEPGLVDLVLRDVAGEPGALPLLSHALRATWARRDGRTLTVEGYRKSGGIASALAQTADDLVASLPADRRPLVRGVFLRLTELGEGVEDTRRRVAIDELVPEGASPDVVQALLDRLASARLLSLGEGTAEVAHEVLIREWPTLRAWLDEDREGIRLHRGLGNAARLWDAGGREPSDLYRGARLTAALDWAHGHGAELNATEQAFLAAGREAAERDAERQRRANRRLRGLLAGTAVLLVLALVGGALALAQRGKARDEALRADAGRVGTLGVGDPNLDRSMLLAVAGTKLKDLPETRGDLLAALQGTPAALRFAHTFRSQITALATSPDGRRAAAGDLEGAVRFLASPTWRPAGPAMRLDGEVSESSMVYSPDGRTLAVGTVVNGKRANLHLVDTESRADRRVGSWPSAPSTDGPHRFIRMAYSRDGRRLAVAVADSRSTPFPVTERLVMLDARSGRVVWERRHPLVPGQQEVAVAFTPQGTLVTSANKGKTLLWDATRGRVKRELPVGGPFAIAPDGRTMALAQNDVNPAHLRADLGLLDLRTGRLRALEPLPPRGWVRAVGFATGGTRVVGVSYDGALRVWDAGSGSITETYSGQASGALAVTSDGRTAVSGVGNGSLEAWDLSGDQRLGRTFRWTAAAGGCQQSPCFVVNRQGTLMATDQVDGKVALVDLKTLRTIATLPAREGLRAGALAFFPDGRRLAVGGANRHVTVWDVRGRSVLRTLRFADPVWRVAISRDGRLLAVQTQGRKSPDSRVQVLDSGSGQIRYSRSVRYGHGGLEFSPDGRSLAALGCCETGSRIAVWDARSGKPRFSPRVPSRATAIAFSPDGRLGAGTGDGKLLRWDVSDGKPVGAPLQIATTPLDPISFSPDGRLLVASALDGTQTLWDLRARRRLGKSFPARTGGDAAAHFAPDGDVVIEYLGEGAIWPTDARVWQRYACQVAGRDLTRAEWSDVLPDRDYRHVCAP
jgi:WD40 repeat protein/class 3 adenylate cyclase/tRNA A-37 threonylcarbamoyl transferase component Bud32/energy-coupling factor transporter ATP-binding protein EcfA2